MSAKKKKMKIPKNLFILKITPLLIAPQCEDDDLCNPETLTRIKPNLLSIENLQPTYKTGDTLWITSTLNRNIQFISSNETIDLF